MPLDQSLLDRIAASLRTRTSAAPGAPDAGANAPKDSILARAADLYASRPGGEDTPPTGFDPAAAALFEALVEGAFLVANADGEFDAEERSAFEQVVSSATSKKLAGGQLGELLSDLHELLHEDGLEKRIQSVSKTVARPEQQQEVLRVAAFIGQISGGVSPVERGAMLKLANGFGLGEPEVDQAIRDAESALAAAS